MLRYHQKLVHGLTNVGAVGEVLDFGETSDVIKIEDINYTFPVGSWKLSVGESMDASKNWPNACAVRHR